MIKSLVSESDLREVLEEAVDKLVVVLFLTNWCGSAVKVAKNVAEVSFDHKILVYIMSLGALHGHRALREHFWSVLPVQPEVSR